MAAPETRILVAEDEPDMRFGLRRSLSKRGHSVDTAEDGLQAVLEAEPRIKRYDVAGRKVIVYIEDMAPGDVIEFQFEALASYPVRAKGVTSQVYSYYKPEWKGETLSQPVVVGE